MTRSDADWRNRARLKGRRELLSVAALIIAGIFIARHLLPYGFSASPDVAHHYALIRWLMEHWSVGTDAPPVLGEMAIYPRYAHALAAVLGTMFNSPFIGMQLVTTLALLTCWASIANLSRLFPGSLSWVFSITLIALLALNSCTLHLDLFGHEIVVNYFFSQMVGQACLMVVLFAAAASERARGGGSTASVALAIIASSLAFAGIHLLPALEGIAYGLLLLTVHAFSARGPRLGWVALVGLVAVAAGALLLSHPAFKAMRAISENDGYLPLAALDSLPRLLTLAIATGVLSVALVGISVPGHRWYSPRLAAVARHLGCAGAAVSGLCVLQAFAAVFGYGSNYACRKYAFGLVTFFALNASALMAYGLRRLSHDDTERLAPFSWLQPAILIVTFWIFALAGSSKAVDAETFLPLERIATLARDDGSLAGDRQAYARGLVVGDISTVANYLVSQAIFRAPRDANGLAPLYNRDFPDPRGVGAIFTSAGATPWSTPECRTRTLGDGYVVTDGQCLIKKFSSDCGDKISLTVDGFFPGGMMTGFGDAEPEGRWTVAKTAILSCNVENGALPTSALIDVQPFSPGGRTQTVEISVNGGPVVRQALKEATTLQVDVPKSRTADAGVHIAFSILSPVSPRDAGLSADGRALGVMVKQVRFRH